MAAARKKKVEEPVAKFTLGDVSVSIPLDVQSTVERSEQVARQALHRLADFGSVELDVPEGVELPEPVEEHEPVAE